MEYDFSLHHAPSWLLRRYANAWRELPGFDEESILSALELAVVTGKWDCVSDVIASAYLYSA